MCEILQLGGIFLILFLLWKTYSVLPQGIPCLPGGSHMLPCKILLGQETQVENQWKITNFFQDFAATGALHSALLYSEDHIDLYLWSRWETWGGGY